MQIRNIAIYGIFPAILGVRNSYKSVDKSDSKQVHTTEYNVGNKVDCYNYSIIGEADMKLLKALSKRNDEYGEAERKFLRQIFVGMDIVGSLKFYAQHDTYKVGTVRNSQSTMHTLTIRPINQDDFERDINSQQIEFCNKLISDIGLIKNDEAGIQYPYMLMNNGATQFLDKQDLLDNYYERLDANLPAGYLLKSYWTGNYEVLRKIYRQRKKHKMYWWKQFCEVIEKLPYAKEFIIGD